MQTSDIKELLSNDLKAMLLAAKEEMARSPLSSQVSAHVDKLLLQIDYYQLLSHLSNSSCVYLPFAWEEMQEGSIELKKSKEERFYCDIELKLKEWGEVKLRLTLYEQNSINLHLYSDNASFRERVKENIGLLRSALIESNITPREMRVSQMEQKKQSSPYEAHDSKIDIGFEVKA